MTEDAALADRVADHFTVRAVAFETLKMMGGICFMIRGKMCVGVTRNRLMVRLDPALGDAPLARPGCVPMDLTGRRMKGFFFVHAEGHAEEEDLQGWLDLALEFNPRAKSAKSSKKAR
ncbi:TfoX/Sxy family transcriptional regulator of competence genes [Haloferula luteola]|uniref:TfoX/Sxy family transcriptional regulator of competence genes n=1 Tax=Haloferula luteola TaxID=595692 RepID=A0A840V6A3_9BACT|nr:TfoX/Sxy family protein [Haloferula luteola]MBB5353555.1 TfoX/Sxy family transcriptional regulator of competence genes [Haloferula luteola]